MDVLLAPVLYLWFFLPFAVALTPPVVMISTRRAPVAAVLLYVLALGLVVRFYVAANANMDWADRTGGAGSIWAGGSWLVAGTVAAAVSVVLVVRGRRPVTTRS